MLDAGGQGYGVPDKVFVYVMPYFNQSTKHGMTAQNSRIQTSYSENHATVIE